MTKDQGLKIEHVKCVIDEDESNTNGTSRRHRRVIVGTASKARGWQSSHMQRVCP
jgi:hypothetical protein